MIIHTDEQGSPEWHESRAGVITASVFADARTRLKKTGEFGATAQNYAFRLALERVAGKPLDDGMETWAMKRGRDLEPAARAAYAKRIGKEIQTAGFCTNDSGKFGASADGFIGEDAGLEIKCLVDPARIRTVIVDNNLSEFMDQIQGGMWITGRDRWHFVLYLPQMLAAGRSIYSKVVERDVDYIRAMERDLAAFDRMVQDFEVGVRQNLPQESTEPF